MDRFGIGWRRELAAGIVANLDRIDVIEVIADDYFDSPAREIRALQTLSSQVPVVLHGVGLGLASCAPVDPKRLSRMARLLDRVRPESWSEHLAFVRANEIEIGHLAAPPRNAASIEGTQLNLERARRVTGTQPLVENVATLLEPPGSDRTEAEWVCGILAGTASGLLLDLHNLYANALNFGFDPRTFMNLLPLERVASIHLAGGRWISAGSETRLLDDHLHDVPEPVYDLLHEVGRRFLKPLTVILERDGAFPTMSTLLGQLDQARAALAAGRAEAKARVA